MRIEKINKFLYKRFFAFGCSMTNYYWPTWADIIGKEIPFYENWGKGGAGNQFIFNSVVECSLRNFLSKDDLVGVMWTSCSREDRYVDNEWLVAATEHREEIYGKDWMKKFGNQGKGLMIRDFASIYSIQKLLDSLGCDWFFLNSQPLIRFDIDRAEKDVFNELITINELELRWVKQQKDLSKGNSYRDSYLADQDVINLYKEMFLNIKEPILNLVLENTNRPNFGDKHATPIESLKYLDIVMTHNLKATEFVTEWDNIVNKITTKNSMPVTFNRRFVNRF